MLAMYLHYCIHLKAMMFSQIRFEPKLVLLIVNSSVIFFLL
jgi:hypothetical protein